MSTSQPIVDFLKNFDSDREIGDIDPVESWWVERQEALERAGYMLRPRYRPGWKPPWAGTNREYSRYEDGQLQWVRVNNFKFALLGHFIYEFSCVCVWMQLGSPTGDL
jgi:hypothetical protein